MNGLRLSPEELFRYQEVAARVDGYADGVRSAMEWVKSQTIKAILADRQQNPEPKE